MVLVGDALDVRSLWAIHFQQDWFEKLPASAIPYFFMLRSINAIRSVVLRRVLSFTAPLFIGSFLFAEAVAFDPIALFLTWQRDPTTTMTIDWHLKASEGGREVLQYQADGSSGEWLEKTGAGHPFPFSDRRIMRVELTGLEPATTYHFRFGDDSRVFKFHTMPTHARKPIRFLAGGDTRHSQIMMENMNREALRYDPDFIVWGGDLAYANGRNDLIDRWYEWFEAIKETLITAEGRAVPIVLAPGNHEVLGGSHRNHENYEQTDEWRERIAPYFYGLFAFPGHPGYGVLDFGDYLSLVLLDSAHTNPIHGEQTEWLKEVLAERKGRPHILPVYHVPAYPGVRDFNVSYSQQVRELWLPLFEEAGVRVAFEHHDHAYKRTLPLREGEVAPDGIVYLGDGAWGVEVRPVHPVDQTWYLARSEAVHHAIVVTLHGAHDHYLVVAPDGQVVDEYPESAKPVLPKREAVRPHDALHKLRENEHAWATEVAPEEWKPLDLSNVVNRGLRSGASPWLGAPLRYLEPGHHDFHGVPFEVIDDAANEDRGVIALRSLRITTGADGGELPDRVDVPVNERVGAVYILHGAGWVSAFEEMASYRFIYEDGSFEEMPVIPLGEPYLPGDLEERLPAANIQDWWPGFPHFNEEGVRQLPVVNWENPEEYTRYLYSVEWINPHPEKALARIEIASAEPHVNASLFVLGITVATSE